IVDRDDVRVIEARGEPRLAQQSLPAALVLGKALRQDLERHRTSQPRVAREVDLAHAAAPDSRLDLVDAERGPFERVWMTHRGVPWFAPSPTRPPLTTGGRSDARRRPTDSRCSPLS